MINYEFPVINTIDDVLPHIEGVDEFLVIDKGDFTVIQYAFVDKTTFPDITDLSSKIRRECRGLVFCNKTKKILRRPFHKFFNIGEREETMPNNIQLSGHVLEKLDGSLIAPFILNGEIIWGTKMVAMDFHETVKEFVADKPGYSIFVQLCHDMNMTPIFEWISPNNRIVVPYQEPNLILTAVRDTITGAYYEYPRMKGWEFYVPVVNLYEHDNNLINLMASVSSAKDFEGVVIRNEYGHSVKMKGDWYVTLHKTKDVISQEKEVVRLFINGDLDDLKPNLMQADLDRVEKFEQQLHHAISGVCNAITECLETYRGVPRKEFALSGAKNYNPLTTAAIFNFYDKEIDKSDIMMYIAKTIDKNCGSSQNYKNLKEQWLHGTVF